MYFFVFQEALIRQLLPFREEVTLPAMEAFCGYDLTMAALYAVAGAFVVAVVLYTMGWFAGGWMASRYTTRHAELSEKFRTIFLFLCLVVSSPVGFAIAFGAGLFRAPAYLALPMMLLGIWAHYAMAYMF